VRQDKNLQSTYLPGKEAIYDEAFFYSAFPGAIARAVSAINWNGFHRVA